MSESPTGPLSDSVLGTTSAQAGRAAPVEPRPTQVGPYRILEPLGEGGMGEVYKAERREPIRQTVAVKIIKLGLDSREIVARFESERQTLAMMDHPGIARVLDAGTTDIGHPYFVMDYVAGKPITLFCDENKLSIPQRLELFCDVCDAISHAHTKAIIHRDIKASNVLAFFQDGRPAVKVIDFGVAKALTGSRLTELTFNTERGRPIGTYDCMSPEQAEGSPDVDTRTDVYALGVLLYELLTGAKPFDRNTLAHAADAEIKRIIREVDPPRPSTRLSSLDNEKATALADQRQVKLDHLARQLRGELEWIPLKAMRKDRARRYASTQQFKDDLQRYLAGKPLLAGPETRAYRAKKFIRRNQRGVATLLAMSAALLIGIALYIHNIRAEQQRTKLALVDSEAQRLEAQKQARIAEDSSNFLANIFRNADPTKSLGAEVTVIQALDEAVRSLDDGTKTTEPITEAMVRFVVGTTLHTLGRLDEALVQLRKARELDLKHRSPGDPQIIVTLNDLAFLLKQQDKLDEAEPLFREVLRMNQAADDQLGIAKTLSHLATVDRDRGKLSEAESLLKESLAIRRRMLPADDPEVATAINNLAQLFWAQGRMAEVEPLAREVLAMRQAALPAGHPHIGQSLHNLAAVLRDRKRFADAEPLALQALDIRRKTLPPEHPDTAVALHTLAGICNGQQRYAEGETYCRESLDIRRKSLPPEHPQIANSAADLAWLLQMQGKLAEAEPLYREALQLRAARFGDNHPTTVKTAGLLADLLEKTGRTEEAKLFRKTLATPTTQRGAGT